MAHHAHKYLLLLVILSVLLLPGVQVDTNREPLRRWSNCLPSRLHGGGQPLVLAADGACTLRPCVQRHPQFVVPHALHRLPVETSRKRCRGNWALRAPTVLFQRNSLENSSLNRFAALAILQGILKNSERIRRR